jgi:hypothetical protein
MREMKVHVMVEGRLPTGTRIVLWVVVSSAWLLGIGAIVHRCSYSCEAGSPAWSRLQYLVWLYCAGLLLLGLFGIRIGIGLRAPWGQLLSFVAGGLALSGLVIFWATHFGMCPWF